MEEAYFKESYDVINKDIKKAVSINYDLFQNPQISLLKYSENIICLITDAENRKAVVRINRPNYHNAEELESELAWITQIRKWTDINTAVVYHGRNGKVLQNFTSAGGFEYTYSIQSFVEGKTLKELENGIYDGMEKVGMTAAKLHLLEEKFPHDKNNFKRFTWDINDTLSEEARWGHFLLFEGMTSEEKEIFLNAEIIMKQRLEKYGRNPNNYGLIHSDLHSENLIIDKDRISLIDFDDCGYGWYLYDLASAVSQQSENIGEFVSAYLKGYQKIRKLSEADMREIDTFVLMRRFVRLGWMTTRKDNGVFEREGKKYYKKTKEMVCEYLEKSEM